MRRSEHRADRALAVIESVRCGLVLSTSAVNRRGVPLVMVPEASDSLLRQAQAIKAVPIVVEDSKFLLRHDISIRLCGDTLPDPGNSCFENLVDGGVAHSIFTVPGDVESPGYR